MHEGGDGYQLVIYTQGTAKDEAGATHASTHASVTPAASLGYKAKCDQGQLGFPKSFFDPAKHWET